MVKRGSQHKAILQVKKSYVYVYHTQDLNQHFGYKEGVLQSEISSLGLKIIFVCQTKFLVKDKTKFMSPAVIQSNPIITKWQFCKNSFVIRKLC